MKPLKKVGRDKADPFSSPGILDRKNGVGKIIFDIDTIITFGMMDSPNRSKTISFQWKVLRREPSTENSSRYNNKKHLAHHGHLHKSDAESSNGHEEVSTR